MFSNRTSITLVIFLEDNNSPLVLNSIGEGCSIIGSIPNFEHLLFIFETTSLDGRLVYPNADPIFFQPMLLEIISINSESEKESTLDFPL
jgi:hypothetical protein